MTGAMTHRPATNATDRKSSTQDLWRARLTALEAENAWQLTSHPPRQPDGLRLSDGLRPNGVEPTCMGAVPYSCAPMSATASTSANPRLKFLMKIPRLSPLFEPIARW